MVKKGYKQTEVGVIPEDWEVAQLKYISTGKFTYGVNAPAVEYMPPLFNYIRITDISDDGHFIRENRMSVICANPEQFTLKENDIVFARTGASTGKTYLYRKEDGQLVYAGFLIRATINPYLANSRYVFAALHTKEYWNWVATSSMRSGQPGINGNEYASYQIALPDLAEQTYIAEALEDTDKLIVLLEKQIAKKKAIKQGAMQELLTGKRRLPGFSGEWENVPLRNALTVGHGMSQHDVESPTGKYPILATGGEIGKATKFLWNEPSVLIGRKGTINKPQYMATPFWSIDTLFYTKINEGYCPKFLYFVFCQIDWLSYNEASGVPSLSARTIENIEVRMPEYAEQVAIAELLSGLDCEIEVLEQKLTKYRQIKQGMMQQLLTGKIRLV